MIYQLHEELTLKHPREQVFEFFCSAENLNLMTPPWVRFSIVTPTPIEMGLGTIIDYRISLYRVPFKWRSEISVWDPPYSFCDFQVSGPYRYWLHRHTFEETPEGTLVTDRVDYPGAVRVAGRKTLRGAGVEKDIRLPEETSIGDIFVSMGVRECALPSQPVL